MRILIVTPILPPEIGGPSTYVTNLIKYFGDKHSCRVVAFTQNPQIPLNVPAVSISKSGGLFRRQLLLFIEIIKQYHLFDFIYAQDPLVVGLASVLAGKCLRKKIIVRYGGDPAWEAAQRERKTNRPLMEFVENPDGGLRSFLDIQLTRLSLGLMDAIIVNSEFLYDVIVNGYHIDAKKVTVIKNAIGLTPKTKKFKKKQIYEILSLGRLVPWKGVDGVIKATALLNQRGKVKAKLAIVGDGPEKNNLEKLTNTDLVSFLPAVSQSEALKILAVADVYILNSSYEGSPNQVIEAFAMGTPVVATEIPGTNEIAVNNKTALTIPVGDTQMLARAIERLLTDLELKETITRNARELVKEYTWEKHLAQLFNVFNEVGVG